LVEPHLAVGVLRNGGWIGPKRVPMTYILATNGPMTSKNYFTLHLKSKAEEYSGSRHAIVHRIY
jgi:hypothetical protein